MGTIINELRKKIRANGGSCSGVKDIASGVKKLDGGCEPKFCIINAEYANTIVTADKTFAEVFELIEAGYTPFMNFYDGTYHYTLYLGYYSYNNDAPHEIEFDSVYDSSSTKLSYTRIGASASNTEWDYVS